MAGIEGAPAQDPAAANQADPALTPEQIALQAEERMEAVYDVIAGGGTGVRHAFDKVEPSRPEDAGGTPALYIDRIGLTVPSDNTGLTQQDLREAAPDAVTAIVANRAETVPEPFTDHSLLLDADVTLGFTGVPGNRGASPSSGPEGRVNLDRRVKLVTRNEAGVPVYEDVALLNSKGKRSSDTSLEGEFLVLRHNRQGTNETEANHAQGIHPDATEYARIVTEATNLVLEAAKVRSEQVQTEAASAEDAAAVAQASQALETF